LKCPIWRDAKKKKRLGKCVERSKTIIKGSYKFFSNDIIKIPQAPVQATSMLYQKMVGLHAYAGSGIHDTEITLGDGNKPL
jgi:hypothetical protein